MKLRKRSKDVFREGKLRQRTRTNAKLAKAISPNAKKRSGLSRRAMGVIKTRMTARPLAAIVADVAAGSVRTHSSDALDARSLLDQLTTTQANGTLALVEEQAVPSRVARGVAKARNLDPNDPDEVIDEDDALSHDEGDDGSPEVAKTKAKKEPVKPTQSKKKALTALASANHYERHGAKFAFWERVNLHPYLVRSLEKLNFTHPTPIQQEVLPAVLQRHVTKDVVVSAETGSGKTLVFVLPVLHSILSGFASNVALVVPSSNSKFARPPRAIGKKHPRTEQQGESAEGELEPTNEAVTADDDVGAVAAASDDLARWDSVLDYPGRVLHTLIVTPTRELATQIDNCFQSLLAPVPCGKRIRVTALVGGMAPAKQQRLINAKPHVLICTPGRIWDLVAKNEGCFLGHSISRRLTYLILDEADRLLQSGRFEELGKIIERVHCDVLPSTGAKDDIDSAIDPLAQTLEAGTWDPVKQRFIPIKQSPADGPASKEETPDTAVAAKPKRTSKKRPDIKAKLKRTSKKHAAGCSDEASEGDDDEGDGASGKDRPEPMTFPPPPHKHHRVVAIVTSATLSLDVNYSKKNRRTQQYIRTKNVDTLGGVLHALGIKQHKCLQFDLKPDLATRATRLRETYLRCPESSKELYLYYFLRMYPERTIVFVNAISMLRRLVKILEILEIPVAALHASMQQRQRLNYIDKFRSGERRVLVATDIASRGLDVEGVKYIIHYQVPRSTDAYIHRCGRTARCGGSGFSALMVGADEFAAFKKLKESFGQDKQIDVLAVDQTVAKQLLPQLKLALAIDDTQRASTKNFKQQLWVKQTAEAADVDAEDMQDDQEFVGSKKQLRSLQALKRELHAMICSTDVGAAGTGRSAFLSAARVMGAIEAVKNVRDRADRQVQRVPEGPLRKGKLSAAGKKIASR